MYVVHVCVYVCVCVCINFLQLTTLSLTSLLVAIFMCVRPGLMAARRKELLLRELLVCSLGRGLVRAKREGAKHTARFWASIYNKSSKHTAGDNITFP